MFAILMAMIAGISLSAFSTPSALALPGAGLRITPTPGGPGAASGPSAAAGAASLVKPGSSPRGSLLDITA